MIVAKTNDVIYKMKFWSS